MSGITVVVPNWNRRDLVSRLLARLKEQSQPAEEVVVVDNGSTDGSCEAAEAAGARVLRLASNVGFSQAVNCGIRMVKTRWLAVVNNDVDPASDWLERLLAGLQRGDAWFATGKLLDAARRDRIDGAFDIICRGACSWRAGNGRPDGPEWDLLRPIRMASLTAALFRTELFERVGLLDERFESYLEDVDFGLRCAHQGYAGLFVPDAVAYHAGSATLGAWHPDTVRRLSRNQLWLVAKHYPPKWIRRYGWSVLVAQALWGLVAARHGAGRAWVRGKVEGLRQFRSVRAASAGMADANIHKILEESEQELFYWQKQTGFDWFWRLYFALT